MYGALQQDGLGELLQWGHQTGTPETAGGVTMALADAAQPLSSPSRPMPRSPVTRRHHSTSKLPARNWPSWHCWNGDSYVAEMQIDAKRLTKDCAKAHTALAANGNAHVPYRRDCHH